MLPWIIICIAVFFIGLSKSGLGAGLGLIVVPIVAVALDYTPLTSKAALGLLLPLLILGDILSLAQYRKIFDFSKVRRLVVPTAVGVSIGSLLLYSIHNTGNDKLIAALLRLEIGLESVFLVSLHWWRQYKGIQQRLMPEPQRSWITGTFIGISTTLAHAAGPIMTAYLLPLQLERRVFVGTVAVFFFFVNTSKLPAYYLAGQFNDVPYLLVLQLCPLVVLGAICGFQLIKRLTDQSFFRFVYIAVFTIGIYLIGESIRMLILL
jgi:uncharacterized protein